MAGLGWQRRASRGPWALLTAAFLYAALGDVVRSEQQIPLSVVKLWASAFGGEIKSIAAKYSGSQLLQKVAPAIKERMMKKGSLMLGYQPHRGKVNFFRQVVISPQVSREDMDFLLDEIDLLGRDM